MTLPRLWLMNADCEAELAVWPSTYRRIPTIARRNRNLAPSLLWIAERDDALVLERPWADETVARASSLGVTLVDVDEPSIAPRRRLEPWGWTPSAADFGKRAGVAVDAPSFEVVREVSSKVFSHAIERDLGIALPGAAVADDLPALEDALARACPKSDDKWVIKNPFGFATRERVIGRGPTVDERAGKWVARRFAAGDRLLVEPWLDVVREYGVPMWIDESGQIEIAGFSDLQTNRAGAATGYWIGRPVADGVAGALTQVALDVGARLARAGYAGPAGIDALEHSGGLRPLVEINARWTMGHVAVAASRVLPSGFFFKPGELTGLQEYQD